MGSYRIEQEEKVGRREKRDGADKQGIVLGSRKEKMTADIRYIFTDGKNTDFVLLCGRLDAFLNQVAGGEENRTEYIPYNRSDDIYDVVMAYDGAIPIGCASFKQYDSHIAEVKRVFIQEEYRGHGISKRMLRLLEKRALKKGYRAFILESGEPLIAAMGLYRDLGYHVIPNYGPYADLQGSVCMKKELIHL